jgi:hypothetical protein
MRRSWSCSSGSSSCRYCDSSVAAVFVFISGAASDVAPCWRAISPPVRAPRVNFRFGDHERREHGNMQHRYGDEAYPSGGGQLRRYTDSSRHRRINRRPFGSGTGSPNSLAVSIQRRIASCALARACSCVRTRDSRGRARERNQSSLRGHRRRFLRRAAAAAPRGDRMYTQSRYHGERIHDFEMGE